MKKIKSPQLFKKVATVSFFALYLGFRAGAQSVPDPIQVQNVSSNSNLCPTCPSGNAASEMIQDDNTGNLGIGTATPAANLHIVSFGNAINNNILGLSLGATAGSVVEIDNNSSTLLQNVSTISRITQQQPALGNSFIVNRGSFQSTFGVNLRTGNYVTDFVVDPTGLVGIGVLPQNANLPAHLTLTDDNGDQLPLMSVTTNAGNQSLFINSNGNVGIGNTNPAYLLDISGSANVSNVLNIGLGTNTTNAGQLVLNSPALGSGAACYIQVSNPGIKAIEVQQQNQSPLTPFPMVDQFVVYANGVVQIGATKPVSSTYTPFALSVAGNLVAQKVIVETSDWSDKVFDKFYPLQSLSEIETYISKNKHLPDVPSECDITDKGIDVGEMNKILLQKIEELTLYLIKLDKRNQVLEAKILSNK